MIQKITGISPTIIDITNDKRWKLNTVEYSRLYSAGIINIEEYKERLNFPVNINSNHFLFNPIPIDYINHKEITLNFDIEIEYTTGEIVRINRIFTGRLEKIYTRIQRAMFTV